MRIEQRLSIPLFMVAVGNFIDCIKEGSPVWHYLLYSGLFIIMGLILLTGKIKIHRAVLSLFLLAISLLSLQLGTLKSLTGIFLLLSSIAISNKNKKSYWIYGLSAAIITIYRFYINNLYSHDLFVYAGGVAFIVIIWDYIHPKPDESEPEPKLKVNPSLEVKKVVAEIVQLKCMGYDWPDINDKLSLCVTDDRVRKIVTEERKRLGFPSQESFVSWLHVSGVISPVLDKLRIQA